MISFSLIVPIFNEENYILEFLNCLESQTISPDEVIFIDGNSFDNTVNMINSYGMKNVKILQNEFRTVPYALNLAINHCKSDVIVRLDAHTQYAEDYLERIVEKFLAYPEISVVGGPTNVAAKSLFQKCVGDVITCQFGLGGGKVHDVHYSGPAESVTFGAWRKEIFETVGLFDVRLKRNQDDEFHLRCNLAGVQVFQFSDIKLYYFPRSNIRGLFLQYFEYGLYKPLVFKINKMRMTYRQYIPVLFLSYFVVLMPLLMLFQNWIFFLPLLMYVIALLIYSYKKKSNLFYFAIITLCIHLSYAIGLSMGYYNNYKK